MIVEIVTLGAGACANNPDVLKMCDIVFSCVPMIVVMLVDAILKRDILLVQGGVMFVAVCYVLFNIAVDLLQRFLDPRIK